VCVCVGVGGWVGVGVGVPYGSSVEGCIKILFYITPLPALKDCFTLRRSLL